MQIEVNLKRPQGYSLIDMKKWIREDHSKDWRAVDKRAKMLCLYKRMVELTQNKLWKSLIR